MERQVDALAARIEAGRSKGACRSGPPDARALASALLWMNERVLYLDRVRHGSRKQTERRCRALARLAAAILGQRLEARLMETLASGYGLVEGADARREGASTSAT